MLRRLTFATLALSISSPALAKPVTTQKPPATPKWSTCHTGQGFPYKCAYGSDKPSTIAPTAVIPFEHTRQMCRGADGKKSPCRVYR